MNTQKQEGKPSEREDSDHAQPINLVAARTTTSGPTVTQPLSMRAHLEPPKSGLMTLYFRTPSTRPPGQVMGSVMGAQVAPGQHFATKSAQEFKNTNISGWTVIRMPAGDSPGGRAGSSVVRGSSPAFIHQPFSSHVPRGPAAVASISAAPKSAVATPILRSSMIRAPTPPAEKICLSASRPAQPIVQHLHQEKGPLKSVPAVQTSLRTTTPHQTFTVISTKSAPRASTPVVSSPAIPVAKVYPQSSGTTCADDIARNTNPVPINAPTMTPITTDKISENVRFAAKPYTPSSYLYHDPYNPSVRSFPQAANAVMVAMDSRHLHPSLAGTRGSEANHTSPRPNILKKRTTEGSCSAAKKNLMGTLCEAVTPEANFASVLSPNEKSKENGTSVVSEHSNISPCTPVTIKTEPGISENLCPTKLEPQLKDCPQPESSPRKKPRKQLLAANELMETPSSDAEENSFDPGLKGKVKEEPDLKDNDKSRYTVFYKRPSMSLLSSYRHTWKSRHNHFSRYSDIKPKEEKKPSVNELANQKGILQEANGWKIYHLSAQMDELVDLEEGVYSELAELLQFVEQPPPVGTNKRSPNSDEEKILNKLTDLIKGNLQRSKIVQEQAIESKQQLIKILDHKPNVIEILNKYISKRPVKKKEKS